MIYGHFSLHEGSVFQVLTHWTDCKVQSKTTFDLAGYRPKLKLARQRRVTLLLRIMPTFENLILAAPAGFSQGCSNLNSFSASEAGSFEQIITSALTTSSHLNVESVERNHVSHFKIVSFIVRAYRSANPTPTFQQMAVALDQNTLLTRECVEALIITIKNNPANEQREPVSLPRLVLLFQFVRLSA
jgi:hypothetical protein